MPIEAINEALWEKYCSHLAELVTAEKMSPSTRQGTQRVARSFIRNRWERHLIELPRNLTSDYLAASVPIQEIVVFADDELKRLLDGAKERTKLFILLLSIVDFIPLILLD